MSCLDCTNRRRFARGSGVGLWSMFRVCYHHWQKRHARLHVAGRVCIVVVSAAFAVALCLALASGYAAKVAWELRGALGR